MKPFLLPIDFRDAGRRLRSVGEDMKLDFSGGI
jgi:hypothetical protein